MHTEVYGKRLQDVLELLESDLRVEVAFTVAPHAFNAGATRLLHSLGAERISWEEAVRTEFDVALAAGSRGMEQLRTPLVRISHGAGHLSLTRAGEVPPGAPRPPGGITGRGHLMWRGRVVPRAVALPHRDDLAALERWCPEALPVAHVVGDPCFDRIRRSLPLREEYRRALGLRDGQKLVLVSSTWGRGSSFGRLEELLPRLHTELADEDLKVALLVHPNVWSRYGHWQMRSWLAGCRAAGISVLAPETDWRQPLIAADAVIGDYGSISLYATLVGVPIVLTHFPYRDANPLSPGIDLALTAPALSPVHPLRSQLAYAAARYSAADHAALAARISSEPGRFDEHFRRLLYRALGLGEPAHPPAARPLPLPPPLDAAAAVRPEGGTP
ncbi:hypothetical protein [Streptomyces cacaoi]|uniref:hypothetical protein n=1 Tax=Streptomyces cacaoi TaxID=1898 RepID=UPI0033310955